MKIYWRTQLGWVELSYKRKITLVGGKAVYFIDRISRKVFKRTSYSEHILRFEYIWDVRVLIFNWLLLSTLNNAFGQFEAMFGHKVELNMCVRRVPLPLHFPLYLLLHNLDILVTMYHLLCFDWYEFWGVFPPKGGRVNEMPIAFFVPLSDLDLVTWRSNNPVLICHSYVLHSINILDICKPEMASCSS